MILRVPDAPINLSDAPQITSSSQIGLTWSDGSWNGGSVVLDYKISYAIGNGAYTTLGTNVIGNAYTAISLTAGETYKFKVQARNSVGYSVFSNEVTILAAQLPYSPAAPTTTFLGSSV